MAAGVLRRQRTEGMPGNTVSSVGLLLQEHKRRAGSLENED